MSGQVLESLHDIVSAEHPTYIGGGTDIMPLLKNEVRDDKDFVFLKKIPELHVLEEKDGDLIIGAAMTLTELAESELLNSRYAAIAQAASLTASPQIRNIATVGGNIMQDRRCIYFNQPLAGLPRDLLFRRRHRAHRLRGGSRVHRRRRDAPHRPKVPHRAPQRGQRPCLPRAPAHPRHALFRPRGGRGRAQRLL